ncbi:hypothetical protein FDP41_009494 [Naegleria fowleri]|uniref:Uncharacterized protein n=1 Tax=Naegleria fowleri TaxID=5763 RepID=A0A6A5BBW9_NAEFO|nr:uncharacterized protein FDP41_009494 [Naegleria fowleri]KAF0972186.1 hypothetical protein FDP41_009494 [Naegleria fowleri]
MLHSGPPLNPSHHHHPSIQPQPSSSQSQTQQPPPSLTTIPPMTYQQMFELYHYLNAQLSNPSALSFNPSSNNNNHLHTSPFLSSTLIHAPSVPSQAFLSSGASSMTPQSSLPDNPMPQPTSNSFQMHPHFQPAISDDTIALYQDIDHLYQEMEGLINFKNKQKEINKAIETIIKEKFTQQKKAELEKKLKKELLKRYKNPTRKQHEAAAKIQRWFREIASRNKDKLIRSLRCEIESLKYQLQMIRVEQQTCIQLVRLLFEQVQFLSLEDRC